MRKSRVALKRTQRGATLIIALLILVMIMMYGIPTAMDSMQNERMTGNTRNRDLAFQAAEYTLKKAETWIFTQSNTMLDPVAPAAVASCSPGNTDPNHTDCIRTDGQCHPNDIAYWRSSFNWNSSEVCVLSGLGNQIDVDLVAAQPRYVVERMPDVQYCNPSGSAPPCTAPNVVATRSYYRITARSVGKDSNAAVILQTMYVFE